MIVSISTTTFNGNQGTGGDTDTTFVVPTYTTITIETWGPGGEGGYQQSSSASYNPSSAYTGASTSVKANDNSTVLVSAAPSGGAGAPGSNGGPGGLSSNCVGNAGTTSGGTGQNGQSFTFGGTTLAFGGNGAAAPNGGGGGLSDANVPGGQMYANPGGDPGGGGGSLGWSNTGGAVSSGVVGCGGAGSGAYAKSVYTFGVTANAPAVGDTLHLHLAQSHAGKTDPHGWVSGAGGRARIKIVVESPDIVTNAIAQTLFAPSQANTATEKFVGHASQLLARLAQEIDTTVSPMAAIAQTFAGFSQELDVTETTISEVEQLFLGFAQRLDVLESDPVVIEQTLAGFTQEIDAYCGFTSETEQTLPGFVQALEAVEIEPSYIEQMLAGFAQDAETDVEIPAGDVAGSIEQLLFGFYQRALAEVPDAVDRPIKPGHSGINEPRMSHAPPITTAELEFFRGKEYARNVQALVPPPMVAAANLTTRHFPQSRPVVDRTPLRK